MAEDEVPDEDVDLDKLEYNFLKDILTDIRGIGTVTAARIITSQTQFTDFNNISEMHISGLQNMDAKKAQRVIDRLSEVDFDQPVEELYIKRGLQRFLDNQYQTVKSLSLDDLDINLLLVKALGFTTAEETIEFYLYQRITRSAVTSWGQKTLEDICIYAGAERIPHNENVQVGGKRFDMKKGKRDNDYYIQLKSGPNTMNIGMVDSLNNMIEKIEDKHSDAIGILGMTYGDRKQISSQIRGKLDDFENRAKIGEEFWEFITGDENYLDKLIGLINELSDEYESRYDKKYLQLIEEKKDSLAQEWEKKYGAKGSKGLQNFLEEYTEG